MGRKTLNMEEALLVALEAQGFQRNDGRETIIWDPVNTRLYNGKTNEFAVSIAGYYEQGKLDNIGIRITPREDPNVRKGDEVAHLTECRDPVSFAAYKRAEIVDQLRNKLGK